MMHCDTIKEILSDYIDDSVEPNIKFQVNEHLEACLECNKLVQRVQSITTRLRQTNAVKTSADFDKNLRARIVNTDTNNTSFNPTKGIVYGLSGLTAAVAIYFLTTTTMFSGDQSQVSPINVQNNTAIQQNQIVNQQPTVNTQTVANNKEALVADSSESPHSTPLENRDIQLVDDQQ